MAAAAAVARLVPRSDAHTHTHTHTHKVIEREISPRCQIRDLQRARISSSHGAAGRRGKGRKAKGALIEELKDRSVLEVHIRCGNHVQDDPSLSMSPVNNHCGVE